MRKTVPTLPSIHSPAVVMWLYMYISTRRVQAWGISGVENSHSLSQPYGMYDDNSMYGIVELSA